MLPLKHSRETIWANGCLTRLTRNGARVFESWCSLGPTAHCSKSETFEAAFQALNEAEVVLGPATDGGYYLIGFSSLLPTLFSGISWGTSEVFRETVHRLEAASIRWQCLRENFDLDTYEDLVHFRRAAERVSLDATRPHRSRAGRFRSTFGYLLWSSRVPLISNNPPPIANLLSLFSCPYCREGLTWSFSNSVRSLPDQGRAACSGCKRSYPLQGWYLGLSMWLYPE